jgi:hypothetical protein
VFVFLFENFVGRARRFRRPRFGAKKEEKDEQRKRIFYEDKRFYRLPTKRLCALRVLSAAEAKTSMTLRIFLPIFRFLLLLLLFCFF